MGRGLPFACFASFVVLLVNTSAEVEFTSREAIRLDRLAYTEMDGYFADRHGDLLQGATRLRLDEGVYHFRAVRDVDLRVADSAAVTVVAAPSFLTSDPKDPWPPALTRWTSAFGGRGGRQLDPTAVLTVTYGDIG